MVRTVSGICGHVRVAHPGEDLHGVEDGRERGVGQGLHSDVVVGVSPGGVGGVDGVGVEVLRLEGLGVPWDAVEVDPELAGHVAGEDEELGEIHGGVELVDVAGLRVPSHHQLGGVHRHHRRLHHRRWNLELIPDDVLHRGVGGDFRPKRYVVEGLPDTVVRVVGVPEADDRRKKKTRESATNIAPLLGNGNAKRRNT